MHISIQDKMLVLVVFFFSSVKGGSYKWDWKAWNSPIVGS